MSTKSSYRASSGSLTSPSPSPPPDPPSKKPPSTANAAGLDSSSELSELTEDEQDASRASTANSYSTSRPDSRRGPRRKRSGIVPEPMWDWAYRPTNGRKSTDSEEPSSAVSKNSNPNAIHTPDGIAGCDNDGKEDADEPLPAAAAARRQSDGEDDNDNDNDEDSDDGGEQNHAGDSEAEAHDVNGPVKPVPVIVPLVKDDTRESSAALTEEDDPPAVARSDYSVESEEDDDATGEAGDDAGDDGEEDEENEGPPAKNVDTVPVVPQAPASSSIMAGQQFIKTPSHSPSTSPEPEEEPPEEPASAVSEKPVKAEPVEPETVSGPSNNDDEAENAEQADAEAQREPEVEPEVETEEAELELQPAHRAEALDVLAQIELRFALLREALYVEKMEDLAMEEALILQGLHPEMLHLQNELQSRHDRRLELAAKKRKFEDDHVTLMHNLEEKAIWSWWKHERDDLQIIMFTESNRKRRRLEREKRAMDRPQPVVQRIPQPPVGRVPAKPLSVRELVKYANLDATQDRARLKRKFKEPPDQGRSYPSLSVLSTQEIQNDLQLIAAPRSRYHAPVMGEIGPGMGMAPPFEQHYIEYNAPPGIGPPGHAPPFVHAPLGVHHPYGPPPGRVYHQPPGPPPPPPPMSSIHHPGARPMQGPGAPPPMSGYHPHNARPLRRSPSPLPMQGYEVGVNGGQTYGATNGPGQHWAQMPPGANPNGLSGPSKSSSSAVNGYAKDPRSRDKESRMERDREKERLWHENNAKEAQAQDEYGRLHTPHLHRSTHMHQQLQGVPHHHHVVHRHNAHHHHLLPGRSPSQYPVQRKHEMEYDVSSRHAAPAIEQINLLSKPASSGPYRKQEEELDRERDTERDRDRDRDRDRGRVAPGPPPMSQLGPSPPDRDRPQQTTAFVMTPSQAMQANFNPPRAEQGVGGRREPWMDERPRYEQPDGPGFGHPPLHTDGSRRVHASHSRQDSGSTTVGSPRMRNGTAVSPQSPPAPPAVPQQPSGPGMGPAPPPVFTPGLLHSPSRLSSSLHASPRASVGTSTPKGITTAPISPLPASSKPLPSAFTPVGPGTPGGPGSRLGTPGLAGPGTAPVSGPSTGPLNGHGLGLTHGPGIYPPGSGLAGPAQPLMPPAGTEPSHIAPPKMTPVQLGNGS